VPDLRCSWVSAFAAQGGVSLIYPLLMTPEAENRKDRGHYFGSSLPDSDKQALIEYLKTL
jgi:hypothetical protein